MLQYLEGNLHCSDSIKLLELAEHHPEVTFGLMCIQSLLSLSPFVISLPKCCYKQHSQNDLLPGNQEGKDHISIVLSSVMQISFQSALICSLEWINLNVASILEVFEGQLYIISPFLTNAFSYCERKRDISNATSASVSKRMNEFCPSSSKQSLHNECMGGTFRSGKQRENILTACNQYGVLLPSHFEKREGVEEATYLPQAHLEHYQISL